MYLRKDPVSRYSSSFFTLVGSKAAYLAVICTLFNGIFRLNRFPKNPYLLNLFGYSRDIRNLIFNARGTIRPCIPETCWSKIKLSHFSRRQSHVSHAARLDQYFQGYFKAMDIKKKIRRDSVHQRLKDVLDLFSKGPNFDHGVHGLLIVIRN